MNPETLFNENRALVGNVLKTMCLNPTSFTDREDAEQEGLIGLWHAAQSYDASRGAFSTYATHCIRNAIRSAEDSLHAQKRRGVGAGPLGYNVPSREPSPVDQAIANEEPGRLAKLLRRVESLLPRRRREMARRHYRDGLTWREVGEEFGVKCAGNLVQETFIEFRRRHRRLIQNARAS